jgi:hypothetical protein
MGNSSEGSEEGAVYQEMVGFNRSISSEEALSSVLHLVGVEAVPASL